jgi:hypothetical protein
MSFLTVGEDGSDELSAMGDESLGTFGTHNTAAATVAVTLTDREQYLEKYGALEVGVSPKQAKKYFGNGARYRFYQRQRWMYGQRFNASHQGTRSMATTLFDNEHEGEEDFPNFDKSDKELFGLSSDDESVGGGGGDGDDNHSIVSAISDFESGCGGGGNGSVSSIERHRRDLRAFPNPKDAAADAGSPLTPRTRYIDSCLRDKVLFNISHSRQYTCYFKQLAVTHAVLTTLYACPPR